MKKLLISGFTTFNTHTENSSQVIADMLSRAQIEGFEIRTVILPVAFSTAFDHLQALIDSFSPDIVICLGLAGTREQIELERVAINLIHSNIADNEGVFRQDQPVVVGGPAAYFSTLPISAMKEVETPFLVEQSFTAGAYVCNYLMYKVLHHLKDTEVRAGFIHLPHLKDTKDLVFGSLVQMLRVLK